MPADYLLLTVNKLELKQTRKGANNLFYNTFAEVCKKKKVSPCATALAIGISKSNVTEWKKGRWPRLDVVLKLAKQLGVSPMQLIPKEPKDTAE